MSTETHEIIFKSNYADLKKAEAEYKIAVSNEIAADKLRVSEAMTTNKVIVEQAKLKNQLLLRDDADMRVKQREMSRAYDQALIEDAKRTQGKLLEDQINKNAADRLRNAANTGFAANQPAPGDITSWKTLNLAIKETRSELVRLTTEGKAGGAEWGRYSDKLRELVRQKQLVQRETRLTSQQLLAMSRDLTVVAYGIRTIATDVISLGDGKKSAGELAMAIGGIGLQTLTVIPAIHGLNKALQAAGVISASTITKIGGLTTAIAGATSAITLQIGSLVLLYNTVRDGIKGLSDFIDVMEGSKDMATAMNEHISRLTFGLIDMGDAADNSARSLQQLLSLSTVSGDAFQNLQDQQNYEAKFKKGGEFYGKYNDDEVKSLIENYKALQSVQTEYQQEQERLDQYNKNKTDMLYSDSKKTKSPGSKGTRQQTQKEELNFLESLRKKVSELQSEIKTLGELEKTQNITEYEKLNILDEKIKKQKELNELMRVAANNQGLNANQNTPQRSILGIPTTNLRLASEQSFPQGMLDTEEAIKSLEEMRVTYAKQMGDSFLNMLQLTGLMKGEFGGIVNLIKSIIEGGSSLIGSIIGFAGLFAAPFTGGASIPIAGIAGGAMGGMNANPRMGGMSNRVNVKIFNPITLREGLRVETRIDNTRGGIDL